MERRLELLERTPTYPNPPRIFKTLHESPRISLGTWGRGLCIEDV